MDANCRQRMIEYVLSLPKYDTILGSERIMYLEKFDSVTPSSSSNNQRFITDVYHMSGNEFHVTYGLEDDEGNTPLVEIVLK